VNELHLFAGAGGGILGGQLLGHRCVCAVEIDPYAQAVLIARQNDGTFPSFQIFDDVQNFDGRPWRGIVDIVAGGFPCQDVSIAGKGAGLDGERSGLWSHFARIIGEVRPRYAFIENSPMLVNRGLDRVLCDLASLGFDAQWCVLSASDCGAPHKRDRIWILANANNSGQHSNQRGWQSGVEPKERDNACGFCGYEFDINSLGEFGCPNCEGDGLSDSDSDDAQGMEPKSQPCEHGRPAGLHDRAPSFSAWPADPADAPESGLGRVANGLANRTHRLKAIGNGQVPRVCATAFHLLMNQIESQS